MLILNRCTVSYSVARFRHFLIWLLIGIILSLQCNYYIFFWQSLREIMFDIIISILDGFVNLLACF